MSGGAVRVGGGGNGLANDTDEGEEESVKLFVAVVEVVWLAYMVLMAERSAALSLGLITELLPCGSILVTTGSWLESSEKVIVQPG